MRKQLFFATAWVVAGFFALVPPVWAETASPACLAAIKAANLSRKARPVPGDCWRMGPLHLGLTSLQARTLLGAPDASRDFVLSYRRRKVEVRQLLYVYPRNLKSWLRLAPARVADFHPVTLRLDFSRDALEAVSVGDAIHVTSAPCKAVAPGRATARRPADFPYGFHGLTLGAPMTSVETRFGKFAASSPAQDFHVYLPLLLSIEGAGHVSGLRFASGPPFEARGEVPDFQLKLGGRSCSVTGYTVAPAGH